MSTTTPEPPQTQELSQAVATMAMRKFRIPGDVVNRATAEMPDDQRSLVRWLHSHAVEEDLSLTDLSKLIRYDESTLHRVFNGKYDGRIENVIREIRDFKKLYDERAKHTRIDFIETGLSRQMWRLCDAALEFQRIGYIFGDSQIGKTKNLIRYRDDHNHGSTIYTRMPTGGALTHYLETLAIALRISPQQKEKELRRRIKSSFDARMLLIVDEAHQCVIASAATSSRPIRTIEFIRELFDDTNCGVVICGTNVFRTEMESGRLSGILRQVNRRRLAVLQLPSSPSADDLNTFAAAYGLRPARGDAYKLQTEVIRDEALGFWLTMLRMASKIAGKQHKPLDWDHVIRAHAGLREIEGRKS